MLIKIDLQRVCSFARAAAVQPKSVCLTHSEANPSEVPKFETEKELLKGPGKETSGLCSEYQNSPVAFRKGFSRAALWGEGCRMHDFLLIG